MLVSKFVGSLVVDGAVALVPAAQILHFHELPRAQLRYYPIRCHPVPPLKRPVTKPQIEEMDKIRELHTKHIFILCYGN